MEKIEIIAGREEARLIYLGVSHGLPASSDKRLVVDIGGGSTEFIIGTGLKLDARINRDILPLTGALLARICLALGRTVLATPISRPKTRAVRKMARMLMPGPL